MTKASRLALSLGLFVTLGLGVWMRWALAGAVELPLDFAHVRHAHSHLGAYGVLFPLAFLAWRAAGAFSPGPRVLLGYGAATALAFFGFLRAGYGPEAIIGSTVVGGVWLLCAVKLRGRVLVKDEPLALVPPGIVVAMVCVPFIALTLRRDPPFAQQLVSTFLSTLLLVVVAPSALSALGVRVRSAPVFAVAALLGSASLGVWHSPVARVGLAVTGLVFLDVVRARGLGLPLRGAWGLLGVGLVAMAAGLVPNARPAVLGALHFLVLGPVLWSLTWRWLAVRGPFASTLGLLAVGLLSAPLVLQAFEVQRFTLELSALGGTLVLAWWAVAVATARDEVAAVERSTKSRKLRGR